MLFQLPQLDLLLRTDQRIFMANCPHRMFGHGSSRDIQLRPQRQNTQPHFNRARRDHALDPHAGFLMQNQLDLRMPVLEGLEHLCKQHINHGRNTDIQATALQCLNFMNLSQQALHALQNFLPSLQHHFAAIGQLQLTVIADQQGLTQFILQLLHHLADGRLRHVQTLRGLRKALMFNGFNEVSQGSNVHD